MRFGILTVSDGCHRGVREDESGAAVEAWTVACGYEAAVRAVVPDETTAIVPVLLAWCDELELDVIVTTGGTGVAPRDVTPEATRSILEREVPGLMEVIRARGLNSTPYSALSRGLAGVRGRTFVINLPGSPGGVRDGLESLAEVIAHAVALLRDERVEHTPREGAS